MDTYMNFYEEFSIIYDSFESVMEAFAGRFAGHKMQPYNQLNTFT